MSLKTIDFFSSKKTHSVSQEGRKQKQKQKGKKKQKQEQGDKRWRRREIDGGPLHVVEGRFEILACEWTRIFPKYYLSQSHDELTVS